MKRILLICLNAALMSLTMAGRSVVTDITSPLHLSSGESFEIIRQDNTDSILTAIEAGIALDNGKGTWSMDIEFGPNRPDMTFSMSLSDRNYGDFDHSKTLEVTIKSKDEIVFKKSFEKNVNLRDGANFIKTVFSKNGITVFIGSRTLSQITTIPHDGNPISATIKTTDNATIVRRTITRNIPHSYSSCDIRSIQDARKTLSNSSDRRESLWKLYDSEIDTDYSRRGGDYTIATLSRGEKIEIIYLAGATVNPDLWRPGMIKGYMIPTATELDYDLQWFDAEFNNDIIDASAIIDADGKYLTLSFPYDKARLRFIRIE